MSRRFVVLAAMVALLAPAFCAQAPSVAAEPQDEQYAPVCSRGSLLCPDVNDSAQLFGRYVGHDEPSVLF